MIKSFFFIALLFLSTTLRAELSFSDLATLTKTPDTLQGNFKQEKYLKSVDITLDSSGQFIYRRNDSIRWEILEPIENVLLMTPTSMINKQGDKELARIDTAENQTISMVSKIFFSVLTADWQELEKHFEMSGDVIDTEWKVALTPVDEILSHVMTRVELVGDDFIRNIVMYENGGNKTTIYFSDLNTTEEAKTKVEVKLSK